jgi:anti-sigma B factor antagonist
LARRAGPTLEPAMQINKRHINDVTILDLQGKLTVDGGAQLLRDTVTSVVFQGDRKVILNLAGVAYVDSSGLGELVRCSLIVKRENGAIRLVNLTSKITDLLTITKLLTVFDTFDTEPAAVGSFDAAPIPS